MKNKRKWLAGAGILLFLLFFGVLLFKENTGGKKYELIYLPKNENITDFWTSLLEGAEEAAKEYGVSFQVMAPESEMDIEGQNECIRRAIAAKPDALLISPSSYTESTELLKEAKEAGILLVFFDSYTDEPIQDLMVGTENAEAGRALGEYMRTQIQENTRIGIIGHMQKSSTAIEREKGLREGLGEDEERIEKVVYCGSDYENAYEQTCVLVREHPEINMIAGLNEYTAVGAARAVRDMNKNSGIEVVGFDSSLEQIQMMEEGLFQAIMIQKPFNMGYLSVENTVRLLNGEAVEQNINSGYKLITRENMYTEENQKILFPFVGNQSRK